MKSQFKMMPLSLQISHFGDPNRKISRLNRCFRSEDPGPDDGIYPLRPTDSKNHKVVRYNQLVRTIESLRIAGGQRTELI